MRSRRAWIVAGILALIVVGCLVTRGPAAPSPTPAGSFAFAALGDAPYYPWEELRYRIVGRDLDAHALAWVLHVGDIFWRPCTDERYERQRDWFDARRHPVVYTPGDNEWTDCWERGSGGFAPTERLARLREIFFDDPTRSRGQTRLALTSQAELVENARWVHEGVVFATVHLVGSRNGREPFPERQAVDDAESLQRTAAATAWLRETFAEAAASAAPAVVLAFHANPGFESPLEDDYRRAYEPFLETLEIEVEGFGQPVLLVHGDNHDTIVDRPLTRRTTGERLDNLTRLQVPGSPLVGWVRVVVTPGAGSPFAFEERLVPGWKYW